MGRGSNISPSIKSSPIPISRAVFLSVRRWKSWPRASAGIRHTGDAAQLVMGIVGIHSVAKNHIGLTKDRLQRGDIFSSYFVVHGHTPLI